MASLIRTLSVHQEHEMLLALETSGLTAELAGRIIQSKELTAKAIRALEDKFEATTDQRKAQEIMGNNYFTPEQVAECFKLKLKRTHKAALAEIPFSVPSLQKYRESHVLIPILPASLEYLNEALKGSTGYAGGTWWRETAMALDRGEVGWHLVRTSLAPRDLIPVRDSHGRIEPEVVLREKGFLDPEEKLVSAEVMVKTLMARFLISHVSLPSEVEVVCYGLRQHNAHFSIQDGIFKEGGAWRDNGHIPRDKKNKVAVATEVIPIDLVTE